MENQKFVAHKYRLKASMTPAHIEKLYLRGDIFYVYETCKGCYIVMDMNREFVYGDLPLPKDNTHVQMFINNGEFIETFIQGE